MTEFSFWELPFKFITFSLFFSPSVTILDKLYFCVPQKKWQHIGLELYDTKYSFCLYLVISG